ncbi:class I SAM-dependent methyltransferase [Paenibacillus silviterrae]|uniref:class I SAM-dependent methyltransferase n=1 Tax=Paenibacillus silviterrae TaxID=3242194 RepID=UPI0025431D54|nr:methyltransferase domain-containing protein [Paenibacillus chinjuensis]
MSESTLRESWLFFYKYLRYPKQIGSIIPSSRYLASAMVSAVAWDETRLIAELGAGTGAVTKYISSSNMTGAQVVLFEKDDYLRAKLQQQYPEHVCFSDALRIGKELEANAMGPLDAIISGLPFFNFSESFREQLLVEIEDSLRPNGQFIAFQYSLQMKKALERRFEIENISLVPWNLPPAFVYSCRKK